MKTIDELIACAARELKLRRDVYPSRINARRMSRDRATHEIECMESILARLERAKLLEEVSLEMGGTPATLAIERGAVDQEKRPAVPAPKPAEPSSPPTPDLPLLDLL